MQVENPKISNYLICDHQVLPLIFGYLSDNKVFDIILYRSIEGDKKCLECRVQHVTRVNSLVQFLTCSPRGFKTSILLIFHLVWHIYPETFLYVVTENIFYSSTWLLHSFVSNKNWSWIQGDSSAPRPGLGWLWFGCSTILPSCTAASAKLPSDHA